MAERNGASPLKSRSVICRFRRLGQWVAIRVANFGAEGRLVRVIFVRREGRFRKVLGVIWGRWGRLKRLVVSSDIAREVLARRAVVASCRNFLLIAKRGM